MKKLIKLAKRQIEDQKELIEDLKEKRQRKLDKYLASKELEETEQIAPEKALKDQNKLTFEILNEKNKLEEIEENLKMFKSVSRKEEKGSSEEWC